MSYWIPSRIQKRLLRYALSQLEVLDTDSLDLEQLDIAWGSRTSVELRDVGLQIHKIASIANLPPSIQPTRGVVRSVNVNIPANIFTGSIQISVSGVELTFRFETAAQETKEKVDASVDDHLPSTQDVAEGFLAGEPDAEIQELEAAVLAHSTTLLDSSSADSQDGDDTMQGTGVAVELPGFLAGFLKGVTDRLDLTIHDIAISVDFDVASRHLPQHLQINDGLSASVGLFIGEINAPGFTSQIVPRDDGLPADNRRAIEMRDIRLELTSQQAFFATLARISSQSPSTPSHGHSSPVESRLTSPRQLLSQNESLRQSSVVSQSEGISTSDSARSSIVAGERGLTASDKHQKFANPEDGRDFGPRDDKERFADASDDEDGISQSMLASQMLSQEDTWPEFAGDAASHMRLSASDDRTMSALDSNVPLLVSESRRQPIWLSDHDIFMSSVNDGSVINSDDDLPSTKYADDGDHSPASADVNNLAESKFFSRDEARSMYESAMSTMATSSESPSPIKTDHSASGQATPRGVAAICNIEDSAPAITPMPRSPNAFHDTNAIPNQGDVDTKTLMYMDFIEAKIPWAGSEMPDEGIFSFRATNEYAHSDLSSYNMMPGAFEAESEASAQRCTAIPEVSHSQVPPATPNVATAKVANEQKLPSVEILISQIQAQIDLSAGRLGLFLAEQLLQTTSTSPSGGDIKRPADPPPKDASSSMSTTLSITKLRVTLKEQLGVLQKVWEPETPASALLDLHVQNSSFSFRKGTSLSVINANLTKLVLGIPGHQILGFGNPTAFTDSRTLTEPAHHDIELKYIESRSRGRELHIVTAPMLFVLDMLSLDDRLEHFGGLSGVLDISNTIASQSTVLGPPKVLHRNPASSKPDSTLSGTILPFRLNMILDAVRVDVKGRAAGLAISSRLVKINLSSSGISVDLPRLRIRGPASSVASERAPMNIIISNISVRFLYQPEEEDLSTLLALIAPTRNPYEDDDDILVDTLIRQRKKGSVIRVTVENIDLQIFDLSAVSNLQALADELSKLSNVAKYLPDDEKPGILTMLTVTDMLAVVSINHNIGQVQARLASISLAQIGLPALFALQIMSVQISRSEEVLLQNVMRLTHEENLPMLMLKTVGDEIEPTIKLKLYNLGVEYRVATVMSMMGTTEHATTEELAASVLSSIATVRDEAITLSLPRHPSTLSDASSRSSSKSIRFDITLRDCAAGLNPSKDPSRAVFLLEQGQVIASNTAASSFSMTCIVHRASLLAIDDTSNLDPMLEPTHHSHLPDQVSSVATDLGRQGYQHVASLSSVQIECDALQQSQRQQNAPVQVNVKTELLVVETCADSTQSLINIIEGLKIPSVPSREATYFNDPLTAADLLGSFSGAAFDEGELKSADSDLDEVFPDDDIFQVTEEFEVLEPHRHTAQDDLGGSTVSITEEDFRTGSPTVPQYQPFSNQRNAKIWTAETPMKPISNHLQTIYSEDAIHGWNSASNRYGILPQVGKNDCPLQVDFKLQTFIWNMFDGYDWEKTRQVINQAVEDVQQRAAKRRGTTPKQSTSRTSDDDESEIGDFLFQSIWIAVPPNKEEVDLRRRIARDMDDLASETGTMTTTVSESTNRSMLRQRRGRTLKLDRGKRQKVSIEVRNLVVKSIVLPPNTVETQSSIDIEVGDLEIFDHVPSSTWRKFITYMHDAGPRPSGKAMIRLEIQNVKPKLDLAATEMVIRVTVLPLRLHVDQDTLDFITRFFEFKDTSRPQLPKTGEEPFIQRIEVRAVPIKLDYKPKKIDYAGLRSGRTKEFMNFVILDGADILLKRLIVFGVSGFDKLHKILNDLWVADVTSNQLPTVIQGLAPLRPIVNVGTGVRNLIVVPMQEYQKDGRLVRSLGKGAVAFAKTTTSELARLGAKVAIGTGNILQGAESLLSPGLSTSPSNGPDYDSDSYLSSSPSSRATSSYANQPLTVAAGLRSAVRHLERDLISARDAIIAVGADIRESDNAGELARAVMRSAPAVILKPAIGTSKAFGTALLGAGNALDADSRRRLEDKYKQ